MPYFQAFQPFSVTVTFFMNSITFVMNHLFSYFDISICHSSNRTLSYRLLLTHGFNHGYILGGPRYIHLTKETNAVFSSFFSLLATVAISMNPITKWWISIITYFDIQINPYWNRTLTYHFSTSVGVNHDWTLGVHPGTENSLHSTSIKVIQSLDFTAFSVNFRKDKKTCFHLRNYSLGGKMVDFPPLG